MKQLTAHTQVLIDDSNGATKVLELKDFLLALQTHDRNVITVNYVQYQYDSFRIVEDDKPKTSVKREPETATNAESEVTKTAEKTDIVENDNPDETAEEPKESQPPPP